MDRNETKRNKNKIKCNQIHLFGLFCTLSSFFSLAVTPMNVIPILRSFFLHFQRSNCVCVSYMEEGKQMPKMYIPYEKKDCVRACWCYISKIFPLFFSGILAFCVLKSRKYRCFISYWLPSRMNWNVKYMKLNGWVDEFHICLPWWRGKPALKMF